MTGDVAVDDTARYRRLRDAAQAIVDHGAFTWGALGPQCHYCGRIPAEKSHAHGCQWAFLRDLLDGDAS